MHIFLSKWDPVILAWESENKWTSVAYDTLGSRDTEMEVLLVIRKMTSGQLAHLVRSVGRKGEPPV